MNPRQQVAWSALEAAAEAYGRPVSEVDPRGPGSIDWLRVMAQAFLNSLK